MKKTNRELNQEHERKEIMRVRPKDPKWDHTELEKVMRIWAQDNERSSL